MYNSITYTVIKDNYRKTMIWLFSTVQLRTGSDAPNATSSAKAAPEKAAPEKPEKACMLPPTCWEHVVYLYDVVWICSDLFGFIGLRGNCLLLCDANTCRRQRSARNRTLRHREQICHMMPHVFPYVYIFVIELAIIPAFRDTIYSNILL